jgi:serine/threonine protein kinase
LIIKAKVLIKKILQVDPKKRMTIEFILKDPWITENSNDKNIPNLKERISEFNARKKFKVKWNQIIF